MEQFKLLLKEVETLPIFEGFKRKGNSFYLYNNGNYGILNFQKSKDKIHEGIKFTLNIGICSKLLREKIDHNISDKPPEIEECHWSARIGSLMPTNSDFWWISNDNFTFKTIIADVLEKAKLYAIPAILNHISDQYLEDEWMTGNYTGTSKIKQYVYLTTFLKFYNKATLSSKIEELKNLSKGKPIADIANEHINWLNSLK